MLFTDYIAEDFTPDGRGGMIVKEQRRIVAELGAEVAQMEAMRSLTPRFEAKIQRVLDRVWRAV